MRFIVIFVTAVCVLFLINTFLNNYLTIAYHAQHRVQWFDCLLRYFLLQILYEQFHMAADNLMSFRTFEILYPILDKESQNYDPVGWHIPV